MLTLLILLYYNCSVKKVIFTNTDEKIIISTKKYKGESMVLSVRMPKDLIKRFDEIAKQTGRTRNEIVQQCLEFSIENMIVEDD